MNIKSNEQAAEKITLEQTGEFFLKTLHTCI